MLTPHACHQLFHDRLILLTYAHQLCYTQDLPQRVMLNSPVC